MSILFAGIDGGQSSTVAVIGDESGAILGRGAAGAADEVGTGPGSTRLRDALALALDAALARARLPGDATFAAIVAGVSGYDGRVYGAQPRLPAERFVLMHDAPIAHAGALGGKPGVVVIAGTGSVVYARDEFGKEATYGGWGYLFGDEGSAFGIAREALSLLMRASDDGERAPRLEIAKACEYFGQSSLRALVHAFSTGTLSRAHIAAWAPYVLVAPAFREVVQRGADRLVALSATACEESSIKRVALIGGLFNDERYYEVVASGIAAQNGAEVLRAKYEPAGGALLLAYREAGYQVTELRE